MHSFHKLERTSLLRVSVDWGDESFESFLNVECRASGYCIVPVVSGI